MLTAGSDLPALPAHATRREEHVRHRIMMVFEESGVQEYGADKRDPQ